MQCTTEDPQAITCIDVERRFPGYKLGYEDPLFEGTQDPWHKVIVCRYGHICPAGGSKLWACTNSARSVAARAIKSGSLPCTVTMDGDDGVNAEFDIADSGAMFSAMKAIRR